MSNNFNFTDSGYVATPPYSFDFGAVLGELNQIWTDANYVYAASSVALSVIELGSELEYAYITGDFNTVWANDDMIFLGTASSGIKYLYKTCISGSVIDAFDLTSCMYDYTPPYGITSNNIRYIHGNANFIMWCTDLGVDTYRLEPNGYRSYTMVSGAQKCFMASTGKFYYTVSGTGWSLNRVNTSYANWTEPDYSYITGSGIFSAGTSINDIFITENTSQTNTDNVLFVATSSGAYVIDEETLDYNVYYIE
jgi:hypothetical protein